MSRWCKWFGHYWEDDDPNSGWDDRGGVQSKWQTCSRCNAPRENIKDYTRDQAPKWKEAAKLLILPLLAGLAWLYFQHLP